MARRPIVTARATAAQPAGFEPLARLRGIMRPAPADLSATLVRLLALEPARGVAAAYLFGSRAAGRAHAESDVDIGALLAWDAFPTARARFDAGVRLAAWLIAELGHPDVDLVVLNDAPPTLARRVVTEGVPLHVADPELEHAFRRDVQLRAADLEPFLRRTRQLKREALAR